MLVHLNYSLKWEIFIKLFHIFKLRHSLNDNLLYEIATLSSQRGIASLLLSSP